MGKFCSKCGNELNIDDSFCTKCGNSFEKMENADNISYSDTCPKCHSSNVTFQIVNEAQLVTKHHGLIWWLCIGWLWVPFKWFVLTIPAIFAAIFIGKRKKIKNKTIRKKVCQNCGYFW